MTPPPNQDEHRRYSRQEGFAGLGTEGQRRLRAGRVLIVGVGGLGSWTAELLARAGVGLLRLVDPDRVDWTNLHRQAMYTQADAESAAPKARAAAEHLRRINSDVSYEPVVSRVDSSNIDELAGDVDLILDGTDNFAARFLINDYAVQAHRPWVFGGAAGGEGQTFTILPGRTACLRCVYDVPPADELAPDAVAVLGPAVSAVSSLMAMEAVKLLTGQVELVNRSLLKMDLWSGRTQRVGGGELAPAADCPCCQQRCFEFYPPIVD